MANLTSAGATLIAQALIDEALTPFLWSGVTPGGAHTGVGTGATQFATNQTDLTGGQTARASATVSRATNVLTFVSTYGTGVANFAWEEVGIFNQATGGTMLCRKVEPLGTKTSAQVWTYTATVTFTAS